MHVAIAAAIPAMHVTIPQGLTVGMTFMVQAPDGRQISVCVPEGYGPGQVLTVLVPPPTPGGATASAAASVAHAHPSAAAPVAHAISEGFRWLRPASKS